jgi:hypothetical protein
VSAPVEARPARTWQAEADRKDHPLGRLGMSAADPASPPRRVGFWSVEAARQWALPLALFLACLAGAVLLVVFHLGDLAREVSNLLFLDYWLPGRS